jgi:ribosome-associated protein
LSKVDNMLEFIDEPLEPGYLVGDPPSRTVSPEQDDLAELVRCIVRAADGRKADNIVALRVSAVSTVTSFMVIVTGNSRPQNQAIASAVKDEVETKFEGILPGSTGVPEGSADSGWTVLDYGSVMVHVMTPKSRLFYNVEGQWRDKGGEYMNLSDVVLPNTGVDNVQQQIQRQDQQQLQSFSTEVEEEEEKQLAGKVGRMEELSQEDDPFWS